MLSSLIRDMVILAKKLHIENSEIVALYLLWNWKIIFFLQIFTIFGNAAYNCEQNSSSYFLFLQNITLCNLCDNKEHYRHIYEFTLPYMYT